MSIAENLQKINASLPGNVTVIAVSKTKPIELINEAYQAGQRKFGENKVQEMATKYDLLPKDIEWHMIGHLQSNKVKYIAPFVNLIHSVDKLKLLQEINKRAGQNNRVIDCLLQLHIADEESKFGFSREELLDLLEKGILTSFKNVRITGLMGMATFTKNQEQVHKEFRSLLECYQSVRQTYFTNNEYFSIISMGMSDDFSIAVKEGSNMVRIGSAIFGSRN